MLRDINAQINERKKLNDEVHTRNPFIGDQVPWNRLKTEGW